jgi:hypothetical protein
LPYGVRVGTAARGERETQPQAIRDARIYPEKRESPQMTLGGYGGSASNKAVRFSRRAATGLIGTTPRTLSPLERATRKPQGEVQAAWELPRAAPPLAGGYWPYRHRLANLECLA